MKIPTGIDEKNWPKGGILALDGKSPANCFMIKDGTKKEIESVLNSLAKQDLKKRKLVFIVAAGHGNLTCAEQRYYTN